MSVGTATPKHHHVLLVFLLLCHKPTNQLKRISYNGKQGIPLRLIGAAEELKYKWFPYQDSREEFGFVIDRDHQYHPGWKMLSGVASYPCSLLILLPYSCVLLIDLIDITYCISIYAIAVTGFH